jgi:hypothetical protein
MNVWEHWNINRHLWLPSDPDVSRQSSLHPNDSINKKQGFKRSKLRKTSVRKCHLVR